MLEASGAHINFMAKSKEARSQKCTPTAAYASMQRCSLHENLCDRHSLKNRLAEGMALEGVVPTSYPEPRQ